MMAQLPWIYTLAVTTCALLATPARAVNVSVPASPPNDTVVVKSNFLGVSFELSAFDKYCELRFNSRSVVGRWSADVLGLCAYDNEVGWNASGVTVQTQNYLTSYSQSLSGLPLRIRIGGRSSENYTYVEAPGQQEPKPSDGSGTYGPTVLKVLQSLSKRLGVSYLLSESSTLRQELG